MRPDFWEHPVPKSIECRRYISRPIAIALLLTGILALLFWMWPASRSITGWGLVVFGGVSILGLFYIRRVVGLRVDESGIEDKRGRLGRIPWEEIRQVRWRSEKIHAYIDIERAGDRVTVKFSDLMGDPLEVWAVIHEHHAHKIPPLADDQLGTWVWATWQMTPEQGWALLDWCLEHGATEFSVEQVDSKPSPAAQAFFGRLEPHVLSQAERTSLSYGQTQRITPWRLNADTIGILRESWARGFLTPERDDPFGLEDLTVYRAGLAMLEANDEEGDGYLKVLPSEYEQLKPSLPHAMRLS